MNIFRRSRYFSHLFDQYELWKVRRRLAYGTIEARYGRGTDKAEAARESFLAFCFFSCIGCALLTKNDIGRFGEMMEIEESNRRRFYGKDLHDMPDMDRLPSSTHDFGIAGLSYYDPKAGVGKDFDNRWVGPNKDERPIVDMSEEQVKALMQLREKYT